MSFIKLAIKSMINEHSVHYINSFFNILANRCRFPRNRKCHFSRYITAKKTFFWNKVLILTGEFPYLVYLQHNDHKNDPYCLATLFRQDLILTTATCFERNPNVANISNYIRLPLDGNRHEKFFAISGQLTFLDNFPLGFNGQPWYLQSIHHSPQFE